METITIESARVHPPFIFWTFLLTTVLLLWLLLPDRLFARLVCAVANWYARKADPGGHARLELASLSLSLLGGAMHFSGLRFTTVDRCVSVVEGSLVLRWWLLPARVRKTYADCGAAPSPPRPSQRIGEFERERRREK